MKTSTEIGSAAKIIGEEKAVEFVGKAGFDAWDFSMFEMGRYSRELNCVLDNGHPTRGNDYLKFARKLKQIGLDNGIHCNQSHAPFPTVVPEIRDYLKRAIECTAEAGGDICVIHPMNNGTPMENAEMYNELLPFAKDHGVRIATENMWNWDVQKDQVAFAACMTPESFNAHLDAVNDAAFVACLDIGHAEMKGAGTNCIELIHALGSRLAALHIHDNDKWHDSHQLPGTMDICFSPILKALKQINYKGYFTLEADRYLSDFTAQTAFEGICNMAKKARELANAFEAL